MIKILFFKSLKSYLWFGKMSLTKGNNTSTKLIWIKLSSLLIVSWIYLRCFVHVTMVKVPRPFLIDIPFQKLGYKGKWLKYHIYREWMYIYIYIYTWWKKVKVATLPPFCVSVTKTQFCPTNSTWSNYYSYEVSWNSNIDRNCNN